ncbi:hypothetical protein [Streptomyces sp. NPDC050564]|uniref:InlB B-repeat-containing protein n=1 Tax=Streptomyces sp. NPDC050564 TaxID=3365631 RepID=UPI0037AD687C
MSVIAHPAAGFQFAGWGGDGVEHTDTGAEYRITMDEDRSIICALQRGVTAHPSRP